MSAESPRRIAQKESTGHVVLPQPVNDPSLIDSVAGFIQDVVPQAYSGSVGDSRDVNTWVRVQQADINDPAKYPDLGDQDGIPPLLFALGYGSGVQVWSVPATGEAREVLSWSQGVVRTLCILPNPEPRLPLRQDLYRHKRPLVAMVDNAGPGPQFCSVTFLSLRDGDQVKSIKFSHQVWDVTANSRSVVITLAERIAVFDSATLEDTLVVTTCYPSPDINPIALGTRWLAYADRRLVSQWRSLGGCQGEGPQSVTATVFNAAKSLRKGLREVASSLSGSSPENLQHTVNPAEHCMKGVVTILDLEAKLPKDSNDEDRQLGPNKILAHFNAHCEPIVGLSFDSSGVLLVTADKRGHRFHVFRINPHPCGPTLAYVQHLYVLYRGETCARIQDMSFSADSRWLAISSMRGTTHVFPITPYGGPVGVRTHITPHVVNKLSRFHRSAGLTDEGRGSPVLWEGPVSSPFSQPALAQNSTSVSALAQIRRHTGLSNPTEDSVVRVAACFGAPRAQAGHLPGVTQQRRTMDSLFIMAYNGSLIQYDLEPHHMSGVSKEKVCDDTGIILQVEAKAEWVLQRPPASRSLHPPLACTNPLLNPPDFAPPTQDDDERWLSQVEIVTHAGPHRRLWMGPQFTFITVCSQNGECGETVDINKQVVHSNPVNMPLKQPLIIESGSCSSLELSPNMVELVYKTDCSWSCRLREDLAEAMLESPGNRNAGVKRMVRREPVIERQVNPIGSVVTLTADVDFSAEQHSNNGKVTVIGTETKKISLESRITKSFVNPYESDCLSGREEGSKLITNSLMTCEGNSDSANTISKVTQKTSHIDVRSINTKGLVKEDKNIVMGQKEAAKRENHQKECDKKGKRGKVKNMSKVEKSRHHFRDETILLDGYSSLSNSLVSVKESLPVNEMDFPIFQTITQGDGDIEMQLREASAERDLDGIYPDLEDFKGRKRSLDTATEIMNHDIPVDNDIVLEQASQKKNDDIKENDQAHSNHWKKSRKNDRDAWMNQNAAEDNYKTPVHMRDGTFESTHESIDIAICSGVSETLMNVDDKCKSKKKKSRKSTNIKLSTTYEEQQNNIDNNTSLAKTKDFNALMLEVSQVTPCTEGFQDTSVVKIPVLNAMDKDYEEMTNVDKENSLVRDKNLQVLKEHKSTILECIENNNITDDDLKGFEFDLLVEHNSWSPDNSPNVGADILNENGETCKKTCTRIKNDETTDKDSSDDCQAIKYKSLKTDFKVNPKKGKKLRKIRENEPKLAENENNCNKITIQEDSTNYETITTEVKESDGSTLSDQTSKVFASDLEGLPQELKITNSCFLINSTIESYSNEKTSISELKRRSRKMKMLGSEAEIKVQSGLELDLVPKRSWNSVCPQINDSNENRSNKEEAIVYARSWSSIAAGPGKQKTINTNVIKTNSVEDRDSVYESCNDSVGEEVEPASDCVGSCYFELEPKDENEDPGSTVTPFLESENGSSFEDKSNTDSGEKDDLILGIKTSIKKSKKQKKKRR